MHGDMETKAHESCSRRPDPVIGFPTKPTTFHNMTKKWAARMIPPSHNARIQIGASKSPVLLDLHHY